MRVYVIMLGVDYEGSWIESIYADKAIADAECDRLNVANVNARVPEYFVEEWDVN
jgi:hypothetical protein